MKDFGLSRFLDIEELLSLVVKRLGVGLLFECIQKLLNLLLVGGCLGAGSVDCLVLPLDVPLQVFDLSSNYL